MLEIAACVFFQLDAIGEVSSFHAVALSPPLDGHLPFF